MSFNLVDQIASNASITENGVAAKGSLGIIVRGFDNALGGGEFMYVNFQGTVAAGDVVQISSALVAAAVQLQAIDWAGTANGGQMVGVAMAAQVSGQFGWVQVAGNAVVNTNGVVAIGDRAFWQAGGTVSSTLVASKQILGAQAVTLNNAVISGYAAAGLGAQKAVYLLNRPFAQGQIT